LNATVEFTHDRDPLLCFCPAQVDSDAQIEG